MKFVHDDPEWHDLVLRTAASRRIDAALVGKDNWGALDCRPDRQRELPSPGIDAEAAGWPGGRP